MSAQIQFFGVAAELRSVLRYLLRDADLQTFDLRGGFAAPAAATAIDALEQPQALLFWSNAWGELRWHEERPAPNEQDSHAQLVADVAARSAWDARPSTPGQQMLDASRSPVLQWTSPGTTAERQTPTTLLAPPPSLDALGTPYARQVKRIFAWIRRKTHIVHDYREPSKVLANPQQFLNTVYAFPQANAAIATGHHPFALSIRSC